MFGFSPLSSAPLSSLLKTANTYTVTISETGNASDPIITAIGNFGVVGYEYSHKNYIKFPNSYGASPWYAGNAVVSNAAVLAPDGTYTGQLLQETVVNSSHSLNYGLTLPKANTTYTFSCYVKPYTADRIINFQFHENPANAYAVIMLNAELSSINSAASVTPRSSYSNGSGTVTAANNGWYRVNITATTGTQSSTTLSLLLNNAGAQNYAGNGNSGIYIWGMQFEEGSSPTALQDPYSADSGASQLLYTPSLTEKSSKNLLNNSNNFNQTLYWGLNGGSVSPNSIISPDGTQNASTITGGSAFNGVNQGWYATAGTIYTYSVYLKYISGTTECILGPDANPTNSDRQMYVNIQTGTISLTGTKLITSGVTDAGNGWYRFYATFNQPNPGYTDITIYESWRTGGAMQFGVYGAQVEYGNNATSLVMTPLQELSINTLATILSSQEKLNKNLVAYPEDITNTGWGKLNISSIVLATAPDNSFTANLLTPSAVTNAQFEVTTGTYSSSQLYYTRVGQIYTFSVYAKPNGYNYIRLSFGNVAGYGLAFFNVLTGTVGTTTANTAPNNFSAAITPAGNGYYRCSITYTATSIGVVNGDIYILSADNQYNWTSDGTSGVYLYGAQFEEGSLSSYVSVSNYGNTQTTSLATSLTSQEKTNKNLLSYPENFIAGVSSGLMFQQNGIGSLTLDATLSPFGTPSYKYNLVAASGRGLGYYYNFIANRQYTFSVYLKAIVDTTWGMYLSTTGGISEQGTTSSITVAGGWTRVSYTFVTTINSGQIQFQDLSGSTGDRFYCFGAQLEEGSTVTPYISVSNYGNTQTTTAVVNPYRNEIARTNYIRNAYDMSASPWTYTSMTVTKSTTVAAPDGTFTAYKPVANNGVSLYFSLAQGFQGYGSTVSPGSDYTGSVYAKAGEYNILHLQVYDGASWGAYFDLTTGNVIGTPSGVTAGSTSIGNGWYRCWITRTGTTPVFNSFYIVGTPSGGLYTGDGVSGVYIWHPQFEQGSAPTAYIDSDNTDVQNNTAQLTSTKIELARKNLVVKSNVFDNTNYWSQTAATPIPYATVSPFGTPNAYFLRESATLNNGHYVQEVVVGMQKGSRYTYSIYAKAGTRSYLFLLISGNPPNDAMAGQQSASFNLIAGTTYGINVSNGTTAAISDAGNGWWRCSITTPAAIRTGNAATWASVSDSTPTVNYTGDGTSGIYIYGAQIEEGTVPTAYVDYEDTSIVTGGYSLELPITETGTAVDSEDQLLTIARDLTETGTGVESQSTLYTTNGRAYERVSKNRYLNSEDVELWGKANVTINSNSIANPLDGALTADQVTNTPNLGSNVGATQMTNNSWLAGTTMTKSIYAKLITGSPNLYFQAIPTVPSGAQINYPVTNFDLSTGLIVSSSAGAISSMTPLGNGWYRCIQTYTVPTTNTGNGPPIVGDSIFIGGYGSTNLNTTIALYGAQLEIGSVATAYQYTGANTSIGGSSVDALTNSTQFSRTKVEIANKNLLNTAPASETFTSGWTGNSGTIVQNATIAPDGISPAIKLVEVATGNPTSNQRIYYKPAVEGGTVYTYSVYLKPAERLYASLYFEDNTQLGGGRVGQNLNLQTGTITSTYQTGTNTLLGSNLESLPNGWFRYSWTVKAVLSQIANSGAYIILRMGDTPTNFAYAGDGTSGMYFWGAQMEVGDTVTPYVSVSNYGNAQTSTTPVNSNLTETGTAIETEDNTTSAISAKKELLNKNLLTYPEDFTNSVWTTGSNTVATAAAITSPIGTQTATFVYQNATNTTHGQSQIVYVNTTIPYTFSVHVKYQSQQWIRLVLISGANQVNAWYDIQNGVAGSLSSSGAGATYSSSTITPAGNGWYRLSISGTADTIPSGGLSVLTRLAQSNNDISSYIGNGTSGAYFWGAQLEEGALTPYVNQSDYGNLQTSTLAALSYSYESSNTNLLSLAAEDFSLWNKNTAPNDWTVNTNVAVAPNGTNTADLIIRPAGFGSSVVYKSFPLNMAGQTNTSYVGSIYLKAAGYSKARVNFENNAFNNVSYGASVDLIAGTVYQVLNGSTVTITDAGNGWWRITVTARSDADGGNYIFAFSPADSSYNQSFIGDGTSGIYAWGAQVEYGTVASPYVSSSLADSSTNTTALTAITPEYSRTNIFNSSEVLTSSPWVATNATIIPGIIDSNTGALSYKLIDANANTGNKELNQFQYWIKGATYTVSVYVKAAERDTFRIGLQNGIIIAGAGNAYFYVPNNGTGNNFFLNGYSSNTITYIANGWYRCTATFTVNGTGGFGGIYFTLATNGGVSVNTNYTGDGTSGMYFLRPQVELGSVATPWTLSTIDAETTTVANLSAISESSSKNLIKFSNDFSNGAWIAGGVVKTSINNSAPDSSSNALLFTTLGGGGLQSFYEGSIPVTPNTTYTYSFYAKLGTLVSSEWLFAVYNETALTMIASDIIPSITLDTTWQRVTYTFTTPANCSTIRVYPFRNFGLATVKTGYVWGPQLELGSVATTYVYGLSDVNTNTAVFSPASSEKLINNRLTYSEDFNNGLYWLKQAGMTFVPNYTDPNGNNTATKLVESASVYFQRMYVAHQLTNTMATLSCYVKSDGSSRNVYLKLWDSVTDMGVVFNPSTGAFVSYSPVAITGSYSATAVGNGWYRLAISTYLAKSGDVAIGLTNGTTYAQYAGDTTVGVYVWGVQLETGDTVTNYVKMPVSEITTPSFVSWLNSNEHSNLNILENYYNFSYWNKSASGTATVPVVTVGYDIGPDGINLADKIDFNSGGSGNANIDTPGVSGTFPVGSSRTFSVYLKTLTGTTSVSMFNGESITNVTVTTTWQRFVYTVTASYPNNYGVRLAKREIWGTGGTASVLAYGAQWEEGSVATIYTPSSLVDAVTGERLNNTLNSIETVTAQELNSNTISTSTSRKEILNKNTLLFPEDFTNFNWGKSLISLTPGIIAPDGTPTAYKLGESSSIIVGNNYHYVVQYPVTYSAGITYTISVFAKAAERTLLQIQSDATSSNIVGIFDLSNGTLGGAPGGGALNITGAITDVGNGWYRCSVTGMSKVNVNAGIKILLGNAGYGNQYNGDGTSGFYIWGAQIEQGSLSPYVSYENYGNLKTAQADFYPSLPIENLSATESETGFPTTTTTLTESGTGTDNQSNVMSIGSALRENPNKNLFYVPSDLSNSIWFKTGTSSITTGQTDPNGNSTAFLFTAGGSYSSVQQTNLVSATPGVYTVSVYVKYGTATYFTIVNENSGAADLLGRAVTIRLTGTPIIYGQQNATGTLTSVGNNWYLATMTFTLVPGATFKPKLWVGAYDGIDHTGETVYLWHPQVEAGSSATAWQDPNNTDLQSYLAVFNNNLTETGDANDGKTIQANFYPALPIETVTSNESSAKTLSFGQSITETGTATEQYVTLLSYLASRLESSTASDYASTGFPLFTNISETVSANALQNATGYFVVNRQEALNALDIKDYTLSPGGILTEIANSLDSQTAQSLVSKGILEQVDLKDYLVSVDFASSYIIEKVTAIDGTLSFVFMPIDYELVSSRPSSQIDIIADEIYVDNIDVFYMDDAHMFADILLEFDQIYVDNIDVLYGNIARIDDISGDEIYI